MGLCHCVRRMELWANISSGIIKDRNHAVMSIVKGDWKHKPMSVV